MTAIREKPLTSRQREVLEFVRHFILTVGYPPTVREICERFGFRSPNAGKNHLARLVSKGYLTIDPIKSRGIHLTSKARSGNLSFSEVVALIPAGRSISIKLASTTTLSGLEVEVRKNI